LGVLNVGILNGTYHILDGQHRYRAFEKIAKTTPEEFSTIYMLQHFEEEEQMKKCFFGLNDRYELPQHVKATLFTQPRQQLIAHLQKRYKSHTTSASLKPNYPNIHVDSFVPFMIDWLGDEDVVQKMEQLNSNLGESLRKNDPDRYQQSVDKHGLFLAILLNKSVMQRKLTSIHAGVRAKLWRKYSETTTSSCACCRRRVSCYGSNEDSQEQFHAGHIVSVENGGLDDIDNLCVLCGGCKFSMGSKNLYEFAQIFRFRSFKLRG
jgi:uncharacterized CHY-type Zn-finger protein